MRSFNGIFLALVTIFIAPAAARAATPIWLGEPQTTFATYTFTTPSSTPAPEAGDNPYGSPLMSIAVGVFGTGWQDPNGQFQLTRVPGEGAWDLGDFGSITASIPIGPNDSLPKTVDVFIDMIWYQGPVSEPAVNAAALTPASLLVSQEFVQADGAGSWRRTIWSAVFEDVTAPSITLQAQAPWNGSVVDSFNVYTRYVPEPGTAALVLMALAAGVARRKRTQEQ